MNAMRRALIVGIDHYKQSRMNLNCATADALAIASMLRSHQDGTPNFDCRVWADRTDTGAPITRVNLKKAVEQLFNEFRGEVLFYFSGHGSVDATGGWLVTFDGSRNDWGLSMDEICTIALKSQASDILLVLDCCHAGDCSNAALQGPGGRAASVLREDMTILASSMSREVSLAGSPNSLFTKYVLNALEGGAADTMGWITAPSIHGYVERQLGGWSQQPVYKSHATHVSVVRQCAPLVERLKLKRLIEIFPSHDFEFQLSPDFEPEDENGQIREPVAPEKVELARLFKEYRDAGLLRPSTAGEQLYWTARRSHTVVLTPRGREHWWLVKERKI